VELTGKEFERLVLMYVQEEPPMYPLNRAQELFDQGLFKLSGSICFIERGYRNFQRGETVCGVQLAQEGIDLVDQADPVKVARIWIDHDFTVAATGWILNKMSRDQLPGFLSHGNQEVREAASKRLQRLERLSRGSDKDGV